MTWIVLALIVGAAAWDGFANMARHEGEPPEPSLASRWAAMRGH